MRKNEKKICSYAIDNLIIRSSTKKKLINQKKYKIISFIHDSYPTICAPSYRIIIQ